MMKRLAFLFLVSVAALSAQAGSELAPLQLERRPVDNNFAAGAKEFQNLAGAYFFFDTTKNNRPSIDYAIDTLRLGVMLNDPYRLGPLSGNFELLGEVFGGGIFEGPGDALAGATLVFRYNFVQPQARVIPYLQIGAGGIYTNVGEKESRGLINLPVEFNLQGVVGARFMMNDRWSLVLEGGYRHVSNAEIKDPNYGLDNAGGNVGFGFSF